MKRSRKIILLILVAACFVILYVSLVRPEMKYRQALQKYKPGVTAETIEHDYGVHLDLRSSGNILPYAPPDEKKHRHPAYDASIPQEYVVVSFNSDREVIEVTKLTPLRGIQKLFGL